MWSRYLSHKLDGKVIFDAKLYEDVSSIKKEGEHSDTNTKENFQCCPSNQIWKGTDIEYF